MDKITTRRQLFSSAVNSARRSIFPCRIFLGIFGSVIISSLLSVNGQAAEPLQMRDEGQFDEPAAEFNGAVNTFEYMPPDLPAEYDLSGLVRRTVGISIVLIASCLGCLLWSHTRQSSSMGRDASRQQIEVIESTTVAPRCFLHLINVDGQRFLVSRDANGFNGVTPLIGFAESLNSKLDVDVEVEEQMLDQKHLESDRSRNSDDVVGGLVLSSLYESRNRRQVS